MAEEVTQEFEQEQAAVEKGEAGNVSARTVDMHWAAADVVRADKSVTIRQGGAREIRAEDVTVRQGLCGRLDAERVQMTQGAVGLVRSTDASLGVGSTSAAIIADTVKLDQAGAQFILARDNITLDQSAAAIVVGQHVAAKDSTAVLMFANTVEGNPRVVMDRQMAVTFGAALGAAFGLMLGIVGLLKKRG